MTPEDPVRIAREHLPYPIRLAAAWAACLLLIVAGVWLVGEGIGRPTDSGPGPADTDEPAGR